MAEGSDVVAGAFPLTAPAPGQEQGREAARPFWPNTPFAIQSSGDKLYGLTAYSRRPGDEATRLPPQGV